MRGMLSGRSCRGNGDALSRSERRDGMGSADGFAANDGGGARALNPCRERTRVEYTKRTWGGNPKGWKKRQIF